MNEMKEAFLRNELIPLMRKLQPDGQNRWGVMNVQQMVEHFTESIRWANGRSVLPMHTKTEDLHKMRVFMLSEKPFRENTKNPILSDVPLPVKNDSLTTAVDELENELNFFFETFKLRPEHVILNPIFGDLNYSENIHLLHKHAMHHLRQFGLI